MTDNAFIDYLYKLALEKNSFLEELIEAHKMNNEDLLKKLDLGSRYISAKIPNTDIEVEYDTYVTELSYHEPGEFWKECIDHEYKND